jgi:ABC-type multidrug transport system fused ATPase/permease subunit
MQTLLRVLMDARRLWPIWMLVLGLAVLMPPISLAFPLITRYLIDDVLLTGRLDLLFGTVGLYGGLFVAGVLVQMGGQIARTYVGEQLARSFRERLLAHHAGLSLGFSQREHGGRTMSLFVSDVPNLVNLLVAGLVGGLSSVVALVVSIALVLSLSWQLALVAGLLPPLVAGIAMVITRPLRPATRRAQEKAAELSERLQENLSGLREVVAFGREQAEGRRFSVALRQLVRLRMRVSFIDTALQTGQSFFSLAVGVAIMGYGGYMVIQQQTTIGTLVAMQSLFGLLLQPAGQLFRIGGDVHKALASADRVYEFLDQVPDIQERAGVCAPLAVTGALAFEGVSFAYPGGPRVLNDISFTARPGEMVAVVGPSGAGKTTLMSLIVRFHDPTEGRVLLDGLDLRDLTLAGLRRQIGIVFQDTVLFATSIRENIAFGRAGATEAQIVEAARAAHAWEFIERLADGLDTQVGERGVRLSEGQKHRLAIARALVRDPRILILDEPTAALDARSEHFLHLALERLMPGRTTFVIAHRLATVERADRILVLDRGRIVENGTHAELLQQRGLYSDLFDLQLRHPPAALVGAS